MLYSSCKWIVRQIYIFFPYWQKNRATGRKKCRFIRRVPARPIISIARPTSFGLFPARFYRRRAGFCTGDSGKSSRSVDRKFSDRLPLSGYRFCNHSVRTAWHIFGILKKGYIFVVLIRNEDFLAVKRQESATETAKCQPIQTPEYKRIKYAKGVVCILIST